MNNLNNIYIVPYINNYYYYVPNNNGTQQNNNNSIQIPSFI